MITERLRSLPSFGSPLWLRWEPCTVKVDGRIRQGWLRPAPAAKVTGAQARRCRQILGVRRAAELPPGPYVSVVLDFGRGFTSVPVSALRPYRGPEYQVPTTYDAKTRALARAEIRVALKARKKVAA